MHSDTSCATFLHFAYVYTLIPNNTTILTICTQALCEVMAYEFFIIQ